MSHAATRRSLLLVGPHCSPNVSITPRSDLTTVCVCAAQTHKNTQSSQGRSEKTPPLPHPTGCVCECVCVCLTNCCSFDETFFSFFHCSIRTYINTYIQYVYVNVLIYLLLLVQSFSSSKSGPQSPKSRPGPRTPTLLHRDVAKVNERHLGSLVT